MAESAQSDSASFILSLLPDSTGSFVGGRSVPAYVYLGEWSAVAQGDATVDVSTAPDVASLGAAPTVEPVAGAFTIYLTDVSLIGTFSTPVCSLQLCI
jgi:hypothetical protein